MLRSLKQLYGDRLGAADGEIGHVRDFYFDDQSWVVRYLVADTGNWLTGRQVLLSPHVLGNAYLTDRVLTVNLTKQQIENSPPIESHKPVSRQYEEEYYRYYGWPNYWHGAGLWGVSGFPILEVPPMNALGEPLPAAHKPKSPDAHLRSTQSIKGYEVQASGERVGHVCDFMIDEASWAISQLVVKTGRGFMGDEMPIPVSRVDQISYDESAIFLRPAKSAVATGNPIYET